MDRIFGDLRLRPLSIRDIAYQALRQAIIDGRLRPGERLIEERLAAMLEVSRTPLREAIQKLELDGWVIRLPSGGVQVTELSVSEIQHLYKTRAVLEGLATREAVEKLTPDLEQTLTAIMREMNGAVQRGDAKNVVSCGSRFHTALLEHGGNTICMELLRKVNDHIDRYRQFAVASTPGRSAAAASEHQRILDRVVKVDVEGAETEMRRHVLAGSLAVIESIRASAATEENRVP